MRRGFRIGGIFPATLAMALIISGCETVDLNPPPAEAIRADAGMVVDDREIVALVASEPAADRLGAGAAAQGFTPREVTRLGGIGLWMLRFEIPQPLDGPAAIAALETIEPGSTAGVNHAYRPAATGVSRYDYASALMNWPETGCPARGPVGMLDTGVDPALAQATGARIVSESFARGAPASTRHGTDVAAVLVDPRRLRGATLYNAAVIGTSARGEQEAGVDSLLKALDWMAAQGVPLVNISLAGPYNKLLDRGVDRAVAEGMTLVAAVGNDGAAAAPRYPAALQNVIAVTAVDADSEIYRNAVRGPHVDAAAPGVDIYVAEGGGHFVSGTSMAVPFVTARIAADPALYDAPTATIRRRLQDSSVDLGAPGRDSVYGAGLVVAGPDCQSAPARCPQNVGLNFEPHGVLIRQKNCGAFRTGRTSALKGGPLMASKDQKPDDDRLLAYVAGRLSAEEAAVIEAAAAEDAEIATDIALMQGMRTALRDHETATAPGELGWKRLERAIDAATPAPAPAARRAPVWQVAAVAAVAAVVCWQFVAVPLLDGPGAGYGTASEDPAAGFTLTVAFVPEATEAQIRALLEDTGGRITDGPSALGLWQVGFDTAADRDASLETFSAAAGLVDHVQPD